MDAARADLDALLGALAADPGLERRLVDEPAQVLAGFELTADELTALDRRLRPHDGPRLAELFTPEAPTDLEEP